VSRNGPSLSPPAPKSRHQPPEIRLHEGPCRPRNSRAPYPASIRRAIPPQTAAMEAVYKYGPRWTIYPCARKVRHAAPPCTRRPAAGSQASACIDRQAKQARTGPRCERSLQIRCLVIPFGLPWRSSDILYDAICSGGAGGCPVPALEGQYNPRRSTRGEQAPTVLICDGAAPGAGNEQSHRTLAMHARHRVVMAPVRLPGILVEPTCDARTRAPLLDGAARPAGRQVRRGGRGQVRAVGPPPVAGRNVRWCAIPAGNACRLRVRRSQRRSRPYTLSCDMQRPGTRPLLPRPVMFN